MIEEAVETIFRSTVATGRSRTRRTMIKRALLGQLARRHELPSIVAGTLAYLQSPDATDPDLGGQQAAHKVIASERWKSFLEDFDEVAVLA